MPPLYILLALALGAGSIYFASKSRDFCKFLAGAFFVSAGVLFYLYLAKVSVPLLGTSFVQTPKISATRAVVHTIFFGLTLYFGFIRNAKKRNP